jgi:hypothetical protein
VGGAISLPAQRALSREGWSLFTELRFEGAPPYPPTLADTGP